MNHTIKCPVCGHETLVTPRAYGSRWTSAQIAFANRLRRLTGPKSIAFVLETNRNSVRRLFHRLDHPK